jgi:hypothetical protein
MISRSVCAIFGIVAAGSAVAGEGRLLAVESGEVSGMFYPEAGAICRMVNKDRDRHGLRCVVEPTAGSQANLTALKGGQGQLAIIQSRVLAQAAEGAPDLRALMSLHGEALVLVAGPAAKSSPRPISRASAPVSARPAASSG